MALGGECFLVLRYHYTSFSVKAQMTPLILPSSLKRGTNKISFYGSMHPVWLKIYRFCSHKKCLDHGFVELFCRIVESCILRKLRTSGGRMEMVTNGRKNGGNVMMPPAKQRNGPISGAASTPASPSRLVMLMFGMKGIKFRHLHLGFRFY